MGELNRSVVVTGVGPVTSIGVGAEALWKGLCAGASGVRMRTLIADVGRMIELPIASMPADEDVPGLARHHEFLDSQEAHGHRDVAYSLLAIDLALTDAGLSYDREDNRIGVIQAFEAPGAERTVSRLFEMIQSPMPTDGPPPVYDMLSPFFYNMQPFLHVHLIGKAFGFHGFSTSVHNACASGAVAMEVAAQQIRSSSADVMLVVGGESFDSGVRLEWFKRLELYSKGSRMAPFDTDATGFFVGEGAGAIVLESGEAANRRGAQIYAHYLGTSVAHQGWKQVIPDVRSAYLAKVIIDVMKKSGVAVEDLDLIVPHGAATSLSDGYESTCLAQALHGKGDHAIATAFKPNVGHTLAASAIIDTVCTLLAIREQTVPPTLHTRGDHVQFPVPLATKLTTRPINHVLKLSTGFTGHDAATLFRKG